MSKDIPDFSRSEKTQVTEVPKFDEFSESVVNIRKALKERPTEKGYLTLIGILLDKCLGDRLVDEKILDEASKVTNEFSEWRKNKNQPDK